MNSISAIIDSLGGNAAVAKAVGVGPSTVSEWKRAKSIPVKYWPALVDWAAQCSQGQIDYATLVQAHQRAPELKSPASAGSDVPAPQGAGTVTTVRPRGMPSPGRETVGVSSLDCPAAAVSPAASGALSEGAA